MKKNISINISGIIFHIEEDAYETLKNYLVSVKSYFSTFEDSDEIISDIEGRIAEIFSDKLNPSKQVITFEDVVHLMSVMGQVEDFKAAEDDYEEPAPKKHKTAKHKEAFSFKDKFKNKLYRDGNRKVLSGVCAGVGHYFELNPVWVRLLVALTFFDVFFFMSLSGLVLIAYIVMSFVVPQSFELEDNQQYKKFFRDPDHKVVAGVAGGLAAYFAIDLSIVRVLFIISTLLGGAGMLVYLVIWFSSKEAASLTERMQMEGEPITLENIEKKIKDSFNLDNDEMQSTFMKIVLIPFRLLSDILTHGGRLVGPAAKFLGDFVRIAVGVALSFASAGFFAAIVILTIVFMGILNVQGFAEEVAMPLHVIQNTFTSPFILLSSLTLIIPVMTVGIVGLSMLAKKSVIKTKGGLTLLALWIAVLVGAGFQAKASGLDFSSEAVQEVKEAFAFPAEGLVLDLAATERGADFYDGPELTIKGYEGTEVLLVKHFEADGPTQEKASEYSRMIDYQTKIEGGKMLFPDHTIFKPSARFAFQEIKLELFIPFNKEFEMGEDLGNILRNTLYPHGYNWRHLKKGNKWLFNQDGLKCLNCTEPKDDIEGDESGIDEENGLESSVHGNSTLYKIEGADRIQASGVFDLEIIKSDVFEATAKTSDGNAESVKLNQEGNVLSINVNDASSSGKHFGKVKVTVKIPTLESAEMNGLINASLTGFDNDEMELSLDGSVNCEGNMNVGVLDAEINGVSKLFLKGKAKKLFLSLNGASKADTENMISQEVEVEASGTSKARIYGAETIKTLKTDAGEVQVKGGGKKSE